MMTESMPEYFVVREVMLDGREERPLMSKPDVSRPGCDAARADRRPAGSSVAITFFPWAWIWWQGRLRCLRWLQQ